RCGRRWRWGRSTGRSAWLSPGCAGSFDGRWGRVLVAQGLAAHEHVLDALLGLGLAAQLQEGLALQVQVVLLGPLGAGGDVSAAQDAGQLVGDEGIVLAGEARLDHAP